MALHSAVLQTPACACTGSGTSSRPRPDVSHTTTSAKGGGVNDSHTSMDSLQASDALIAAAFTENTPMASQSFASDMDPLGVGYKRPISPGGISQAGSEAESVVSSSRLSSRPVAGWKGRMSSMLIRSSPGQPKPEKDALKETLKIKKVINLHNVTSMTPPTLEHDCKGKL